jgi:hypothetical protein
MNRKDEIEKGAWEYINSDKFPVIGYPHLAFGDFTTGANFADKTFMEKAIKWISQHCPTEMISDFKNFMLNE